MQVGHDVPHVELPMGQSDDRLSAHFGSWISFQSSYSHSQIHTVGPQAPRAEGPGERSEPLGVCVFQHVSTFLSTSPSFNSIKAMLKSTTSAGIHY